MPECYSVPRLCCCHMIKKVVSHPSNSYSMRRDDGNPICYPPSIRNTGVGAAVAAGRLGTIAGPLLAGTLLGVGQTASDFLTFLIPIILLSGLMAILVVKMFARTKEAAI